MRRSLAHQLVEVRIAEVANPEEIEPAIFRLGNEGSQALIVRAGTLRNHRPLHKGRDLPRPFLRATLKQARLTAVEFGALLQRHRPSSAV